MKLQAISRAIALEALYQQIANDALRAGYIVSRPKFLEMPIQMIVNPEILLDNWRHVKGMVAFKGSQQPQLN